MLAGLLAIAGAAADPYTGDGAALYEAYATSRTPCSSRRWATTSRYLFWGAAALFLAGLVRRRGSWLANVAGVLALLGITTMPGFVLADFYDSAIGQVFGVDGALQVEDRHGGHVGADRDGLHRRARPRPRAAGRDAGGLAGGPAPVVGRGGPDRRASSSGFFVLGPTVAAGLALTAGFVVLSVGARPDGPGRRGRRPGGVT